MKKYIIFGVILSLLCLLHVASASTTTVPGLRIVSLGSTGIPCVTISNISGDTATSTCGSGSGITNITSANSFILVATSTSNATLTYSSSGLQLGSIAAYASTDYLTSSTVINTPSTTIPVIYVATFNGSSGPVSYIVSSTNAFISVTTSTTSSKITFSSSSLNLGTIAAFASTDYLPSSTQLVSTFNGGSGARIYGVTSGNAFISVATSTSNATITYSSSSLNLGSISIKPATDYLVSSTALVTNSSITANAPITWSGSNVIGYNTSTAMFISGLYTFSGGIVNSTNVTTTNATVSSTLNFANLTPSGTVLYGLTVDGSAYLNINVTGTSPGNGGIQPYNIIEQNCPTITGVGSATSSECTFSQSTIFNDGTRNFVDWTTENYPPYNGSGWYETATGNSSTANAFLYPFSLNMSTNGAGTSIVHHNNLFTMTPINATGTWLGVTFGLQGATGINGNTNVTGTLTTSGALQTIAGGFISGANATANGAFVHVLNGGSSYAGIYDTGNSKIYGLCPSLPCASGVVGLGGYYSGLGVGGISTSTTPIFGVLANGQSSNGLGQTNFTIYGDKSIVTYNNTLDSGNGSVIIVGTTKLGSTLNVTGTAAFQTTTQVFGNLLDAGGNKYVTSTSAGGFTTANASSGIQITTTTTNISIANIGVTSATGTLGQVQVSNTTGTVTLSIPTNFAITNASTTNFQVSSTLIVQGASTLQAYSFTNGTSTGNLNIGGALNVTSTLTVAGASGLQALSFTTATSTGAVHWGGNENVTGTITASADGSTLQAFSFTTATSTGIVHFGAAFNASGTITTNGVQVSTTTPANPTAQVGASAVNGSATTFMRSDGAPALSPQYVSSTKVVNLYDATTTSPYRFFNVFCPDSTSTIAKIDYAENAVATTTIEWVRTTSAATSTVDTLINASTSASGVASSTTSFTSSTILGGTCLLGIVSSTVGTPTWAVFTIHYKTN